MFDDIKPSESTAARAAMLWRKMIESPKFDNGDSSHVGGIAMLLAMSIPTDKDESRLDEFEKKLKEAILKPNEIGYFTGNNLSVDYHPDEILSNAASAAGLKVTFPWKTTMRVNRDYVCVRAGYSAEQVFHYPLENGKWLVTTLSGSEIEKIKKYVADGVVPVFTVE